MERVSGCEQRGGEEWTNGLNLVADEEHVVLLAKRLASLKVVLIRHDDSARNESALRLRHRRNNLPCLSLDRLDEERSDVLSMCVQGTLESINVVVPDPSCLASLGASRADALEEGTETATRLLVGRHADDSDPAIRFTASAEFEYPGEREEERTFGRGSCPRR